MESILGVHESALQFRAQRIEVLTANLANADTPRYKARDIEFADAMRGMSKAMVGTHPRHMNASAQKGASQLLYRVPHQPSLDGNTVETDLELARFAENAVAYQVSLAFINGRISGLRAAITGGR